MPDDVTGARVSDVIKRVARAAEQHDARETDRLRRWRVLEPGAGRLLWFLTQALGATNIVEIGTSLGVSTLWLADAARHTGGLVTSVDSDRAAQQDALRHVTDAGVEQYVRFVNADGGATLAGLPDHSVDLLFLDAERTEYPSWWPHPVRVLRPGGVLAADNALSHAEEIAPLRELLVAEQDFPVDGVATLDNGKGELLAIRRRATP